MKKEKEEKLWGGRFEAGASEVSQYISESISFDRELYRHDIQASLVHVSMLEKQKIISPQVCSKITDGLKEIEKEIEQGKIAWNIAYEDIHTHIEKRLIEIVGEEGKFLHTGRSRNDQVAVDTHLYLREAITQNRKSLTELLESLLSLAKTHQSSVWAGYTHLQIAQPVLLGHYLMAYFWKFKRDLEMLKFAETESSLSPLGAAAMAGPNYPVDREYCAEKLGFSGVYPNSMDAVSNRDYQLSYHFFATRLFIHISRFCEDIIIYNSTEFGYITLGEGVTTGSSIMPQKKNPDIAELLRGKSARVAGNLFSLINNLKGLPLTYNRDLQEDKVYLFDTIKQVEMGILGMIEIVKAVTFHPEKVENNLRKGFAQATDIADLLVAEFNVPFRKAHEMTGAAVLYCEKNGKFIDQLTKEDYNQIWGGEISIDATKLTLDQCIKRKSGTGSTSPSELQKQLSRAAEELAR